MFSIGNIVQQFKEHGAVPMEKQVVEQACREEGHTWRERLLDPLTTLQLFFLQLLHGNTACSDLPHLSGIDCSASAYCQARKRLPLGVLLRVVRSVIASFVAATDKVELWHGHRLWYVDGSSFSMSDTPALQAHFGQPSRQRPGCGFPVCSFLALCDAATGLLVDVLPRPLRVHDMSGVAQLHPGLAPGDLLVGDRAFASYAHLALLFQAGLHGVFRLHQRRKTNFRKRRPNAGRKSKGRRSRSPQATPGSVLVKKLGRYDQWVDYLKPKNRPKWMTPEQYAALPERIPLREVRYWTKRRGYRTRCVTLVTTLRDPQQYLACELATLYGDRWSIETNFRHLKTTMKMEVLHTQSVDGVLKELWMFVLTYNLVRLAMLEAATRQEVPVERVSFIDALRWLRHPRRGSPLPQLVVNPDRSGRVEPRERKRRPKEYPLLKCPRRERRKTLLTQALGA